MRLLTCLSADERDALSERTALVCDPAEDKTRQEFKAECDIQTILRSHGIMPRPVQYGAVDFDIDLHSAYQSVTALKSGFARLPEAVRSKFGTFDGVVEALSQGELCFTDGRIGFTPNAEPVVPLVP